jgi:phosphoribosyl-ATP pyrophosphohydrolase
MAREDRALDKLMQTIADRQARPNESSYTARLLAGGVSRIGEKVIEEAGETVEAAGEAGDDGRQHLVREAADLVYHLLVLLAARGATLADLEAELARRFGTSGLAEKSARGANPPPKP